MTISAEQLMIFSEALYDSLPSNGAPKSNMVLLRDLQAAAKKQLGADLDDADFWLVRNHLVSSGKAARGSGPGGTTSRVVSKGATEPRTNNDLIVPVAEVLEAYWGRSHGIECVVQMLDCPVSQRFRGKWARPDILAVGIRVYEFIPGEHIEVTTFNVVDEAYVTVETIMSTAASYSAYARCSYICCHAPEGRPFCTEAENMEQLCTEHGVGLMYFEGPEEFWTYDTVIEPKRNHPDIEDVNELILRLFSDEKKRELLDLIRRTSTEPRRYWQDDVVHWDKLRQEIDKELARP